MENNYGKFTIRSKQVAGAMALLQFCNAYKITHSSITALSAHLFSIAIVHHLPEWEAKGLQLDIIGRGEEVPQTVLVTMHSELRSDFSMLIEYVIEIAMADMYGAETDEPIKCLTKAIGLLKKHGINLVLPELLFADTERGWGEIWDEKRYVLLLDFL